jgi:hypothetical protein
LPAVGCVTASAKPTATAASMAVPPSFSTSAPIFEAVACTDTTIPCFARSGSELPRITAPAATTATATTIKILFMNSSPRRGHSQR